MSAPPSPQARRSAYPLFAGATRVPTTGGVATVPLLVMLTCVAFLASMLHLMLWLLAPLLWMLMAMITRQDDRAFRMWWLWFETRALNRFKRFWQASSYTATPYSRRRPWRRL